jgi:hypothetical protein
LFNEARTYNEWSEKPVDEQTVRELYDSEMGANIGQLLPCQVCLGSESRG